MTHKTYIFVHNTELIDYLESKNKFKGVGEYQYVLLSEKDFDIGDRNAIISKNCSQNIEEYNNYLQFTGWFCLVANKIVDADYITLLEYDVDVSDNFEAATMEEAEKTALSCYGYAYLPKRNSFLNNDIFSNGLVSYLKESGIQPEEILSSPLNDNWIVTSNVTMKREDLISLVKSDLFIGFLNYLKNNKFSGHFLERFITVYLTVNKKQYGFVDEVLVHHAVDSHDTQGRNHIYRNYKKIL